MKNLITGAIVAGATAVAISTGAVSPAFASTTTSGATLAQIQSRGESDIDQRLASLAVATVKIQDAKDAAAAEQQQILARFSSDVAGLTALRAKIAADTTASAAAADVRSIFETYRIYAVQLPQSFIAVGADRLTTTSLPKLQAAHDLLAARGANAAQLAQMQNDIDAALGDLSGLAPKALAITPAEYDADPNVMTPLRSRLDQAVVAVRAAVAIGTSLAGSVAASPSPTPGS